jgi:excisionase family DNA binding protein
MTPVLEPALTVKEVAVVLNVDEKTIYRLAQKGNLPGFKVAGAWRFQRSDLQQWIATRKLQSGARIEPKTTE